MRALPLAAVLTSAIAVHLAAAAPSSDVTVTVDPKNVTHEVNELFNGCHSDSGYTHQPRGLYAQMVLGESFEGLKPSDAEEPRAAAAGPFPTGKFVSLAPLSAADTLIRHCSFELFVAGCGHHGCDDDFNFKVVPALNKAAGSVSFQSTNFPSKYVSAAGTKGEPARAMVVLPVDKDAASFAVVAGLSDSSKFSFKTHGTSPAGFLTATTHSTGDCAAGQKGDVVVAEAPMDKAAATWETHTPPPPPPPPLNPWGGFASPTAKGSAQIVSTAAFHGKDSLALHMTGGKGVVGLANRGLGHEGLVFEAGKDYEGFFFALSATPVTFTVAMRDYTTNTTLATQEVKFGGAKNWSMVNFTGLTPSAGTSCVGLTESTAEVTCGKMGPHSHICVQCGGEFVIGLSQPGAANVDYVYLQPGEWGRVPGTQALASAGKILTQMGIKVIRQGGSFADGSYYFWKQWRGKPWDRPSLGSEWGSVGTIISGWGPFEMMALCDAIGVEPVFTTNAVGPETPQDMADLVEYLYGNASTTWGRLRINDGHPETYETRFFELGNEQYNPGYPEQVAAMEAKARELGHGNKFFYMNPNNAHWLKPGDAAKVEAIGIKDHAVMDIHLGGGGGVEMAENMFSKYPNYTMGAVNAETNAGIHTMERAMMEATDLNDWMNCGEQQCTRLHFRTASFCNERSGHFDAFDQGISFFLPNMTWLQPPGYVHSMIASTWQPNGLSVTPRGRFGSGLPPVGASAQASQDGKTVVVRLTNSGDSAATAELVVPGFSGVSKPTTWTLQSVEGGQVNKDGANPPGDPTKISPQKDAVRVGLGLGAQGGDAVVLPAFSYVVVEYGGAR